MTTPTDEVRPPSQRLLAPERLWSRAEVLARPCPVPSSAGVYAWFFRGLPPGVPIDGCLHAHDLTLLYVGIAPKHPPMNGARASRQTLRDRLRYHYRGNPHRQGPGGRITLAPLWPSTLQVVAIEAKLTRWRDALRQAIDPSNSACQTS